MDHNPAVFVMGEEVGVWDGTYAVTKGFYDKYGAACIKDTPIAENAVIGTAIGAALSVKVSVWTKGASRVRVWGHVPIG